MCFTIHICRNILSKNEVVTVVFYIIFTIRQILSKLFCYSGEKCVGNATIISYPGRSAACGKHACHPTIR